MRNRRDIGSPLRGYEQQASRGPQNAWDPRRASPAKRVRSISARGENVFFQTRDIGHMISLRPFKAGAAGRPIDREEQARSELQSCVYRGPLRQAVLDMVQQYLRDRYLERSGIALLGTSIVSNSCWKDAG